LTFFETYPIFLILKSMAAKARKKEKEEKKRKNSLLR
jgi:hypothetical protein